MANVIVREDLIRKVRVASIPDVLVEAANWSLVLIGRHRPLPAEEMEVVSACTAHVRNAGRRARVSGRTNDLKEALDAENASA
jgi:hypothetical protein